jgi:serine/threonine-protein phosphatase 2A regulatory subunit B''
MKVEDFVAITKDLCGFPSFFNAPFFRRILSAANNGEMPSPTATDDSLKITKEMFVPFWLKELAPHDDVERFFRVVRGFGSARWALWQCVRLIDLCIR